jgi:hypothetical protein
MLPERNDVIANESGVSAEAKAKAREMYLATPLPVLSQIGKAVGIHYKTLGRIRDREGWDLERLSKQQEKLEELEASGLGSKQSAKDLLESCKKIINLTNVGIGNLNYRGSNAHDFESRLMTLTNVVAKVNELQKDAYKRIGC